MQDDNRGLFQGKLHPIQNECYSYTIIDYGVRVTFVNGVRVTFVSDRSLVHSAVDSFPNPEVLVVIAHFLNPQIPGMHPRYLHR